MSACKQASKISLDYTSPVTLFGACNLALWNSHLTNAETLWPPSVSVCCSYHLMANRYEHVTVAASHSMLSSDSAPDTVAF